MSSTNSSGFTHSTSDAYDRFIGRYSKDLSPMLTDQAGVTAGMTALDVGSGSGRLTGELVRRLGSESVNACDPSPVFVADCQAQFPDLTVVTGYGEALPFDSNRFDVTLAQLVFHFLTDADQTAAEMRRVTKSGGCIGASTWDMSGGMELLRFFAEAASTIDPVNRPYVRPQKLGLPGEIVAVFERAGLVSIDEQLHTISVPYADFAEFWGTVEHATGAAGTFVEQSTPDELARLHDALFERVGSPPGPFALSATALSITGRVP